MWNVEKLKVLVYLQSAQIHMEHSNVHYTGKPRGSTKAPGNAYSGLFPVTDIDDPNF